MKLTEKTPKKYNCIIGACPAVFETDQKSYVVIGKVLSKSQVNKLLKGRVGKDEMAVEFPKGLLENII